jgi:hypothetical protein
MQAAEHQRGIVIRTNVVAWFAVVVFAYYYKALLCGFLGHTLGLDFICFTWIAGISTNHWIEIVVYCPLLWFALHQVNADVFGHLPADRRSFLWNRRLHLVGELAIALVIYGTGIHIANVIEIYARERSGDADGDLYNLIYLLDEGISHYVQFVPLFFVIGWFIINDRPGRTAHPLVAVFFGVGHGVERAVGIIEGAKWFLGPPTVVWIAFAAWLRWRKHGREAANEFFFRYAVAFSISLPVSQAAYFLRFNSFDQPSGLTDNHLAQIAIGAILLTGLGTALLASADRWWRGRRASLQAS